MVKFLSEEELKKTKASDVAKGDKIVLDNGDTGDIVALEKTTIHVPARKVTTIVVTVQMTSGQYAGKAVDIHLEGTAKVERKQPVPRSTVLNKRLKTGIKKLVWW